MATKRKQPEQQQAGPSYTVRDCSIINTSAANKHTRAAVEALAAAAKANAEAITAIAAGLKGSLANLECGIKFGG